MKIKIKWLNLLVCISICYHLLTYCFSVIMHTKAHSHIMNLQQVCNPCDNTLNLRSVNAWNFFHCNLSNMTRILHSVATYHHDMIYVTRPKLIADNKQISTINYELSPCFQKELVRNLEINKTCLLYTSDAADE